jgi:hypothetical protein
MCHGHDVHLLWLSGTISCLTCGVVHESATFKGIRLSMECVLPFQWRWTACRALCHVGPEAGVREGPLVESEFRPTCKIRRCRRLPIARTVLWASCGVLDVQFWEGVRGMQASPAAA